MMTIGRLSSWFAGSLAAAVVLVACGSDGGDAAPNDDGETTTGGTTTEMPDPNANADGDCLLDSEELELGTDPNSIDSDLDGTSDCDEIACVSNPIDGGESCYACGWAHNDPGNLVSTGAEIGSVMADFILPDQCGEGVSIWDFAGSYRILHLIPAW